MAKELTKLEVVPWGTRFGIKMIGAKRKSGWFYYHYKSEARARKVAGRIEKSWRGHVGEANSNFRHPEPMSAGAESDKVRRHE